MSTRWFEPKDSSNIVRVEYCDGGNKVLTVFFRTAIYDYENVDAEIYNELETTYTDGESVGKAFNRLVRGKIDGVKRLPPQCFVPVVDIPEGQEDDGLDSGGPSTDPAD